MSNKNFKLSEREVKLLMQLLYRLEKRIYLLRVSLYGEIERSFPSNIDVTQDIIEGEKDVFKNTYNISADEYKIIVDSCEIETCIRRVLHEMENSQTFNSLKDVVTKFEDENISFKKHQKMIREKKKQVEQLKEVLSKEQSQANVQCLNAKTQDMKEKSGDRVESFCETEFLKKLMDHKVQSRKNYYDYKQAALEERIEWFQREARVQVHANAQIISFWLLKYDTCCENLDAMLKEVFDNWEEKKREYGILRKFRILNLERIQKLHKLISEREDYIERYRIKKEKQQKETQEKLRREDAATKIQAYWRGTMVRRHLGPYKIKKKKKGKKSKGKKAVGKKKMKERNFEEKIK